MTAVGCDLKVTTRSSSRCWRARRRHARWSRRSRETGNHDLRSGDRPLHLPARRLPRVSHHYPCSTPAAHPPHVGHQRNLGHLAHRIARGDRRRLQSPQHDPRHHRRRVLVRSEEHTSELQSQSNLVCRLLLEKKKTKKCKLTYAEKNETHTTC